MGRLLLVLIALFLAASVPLVRADDLSTKDIVISLDPHTSKTVATRSFKRGITVQPGTAQDGPPSVNLYVNFAFDSAELTSDGEITLDKLGKALLDPRLQQFSFLIAGHTDAKGTDQYNQGLSERRATAVRNYLMDRYGIAPARLESKGFGRTRLLDPQHPEDGINRRVQIVTLNGDPSQTNN